MFDTESRNPTLSGNLLDLPLRQRNLGLSKYPMPSHNGRYVLAYGTIGPSRKAVPPPAIDEFCFVVHKQHAVLATIRVAPSPDRGKTKQSITTPELVS